MSLLQRAFLAALPNAPGRQALADLRLTLMQALPAVSRVWTSNSDLHLTLRFLADLELPVAESWRAFVDAQILPAAFILRFTRLEFWPPRAPRLAVACFQSTPPLDAWVQNIEAEARRCGLKAETRPHLPHVTLLRAGRRIDPPALKLAPFEVCFDRLALMMRAESSDPSARYAAFAGWDLTAG